MRILLAGFSVFALCVTALGGSLTPPGAPAPTMKTLAEVEPRTAIHAADLPLTITAPGSYYLAENIKISASDPVTTSAIIIESDSVTIDLNGFNLAGSIVPNVSAIVAAGPFDHIVIRNGCVHRWEEQGIRLEVNSAIVENVTTTDIHGTAIVMATGQVIDCVISNNLSGIFFSTPVAPLRQGQCVISGCTVLSNGENGIRALRPVAITNTVSSHNGSNGISLDGPGSVVRTCVASENFRAGISISSNALNCTVVDNTCVGNDETGIYVNAQGCRIEGNHMANNDIYGLTVNKRSMVIKNTAFDNADANYNLVSEAVAGPIVTDAAGGTISSDHPWANLSFHTSKIGN